MLEAAQKFSDDPLDLTTRNLQSRTIRALLSSVTRLLVLADMIDVNRLVALSDRLHELFALFRNPSQTSNEHDIGIGIVELLNCNVRTHVSCDCYHNSTPV